jgi:histone H1/5
MSAPVASKKSYFELAKEAIAALKERSGSSTQAIKAHIVFNHPSIKFAQHSLRSALKKGAESGKLVKVKASFKLAEAEKEAPKKAVAKKVAAPKKAVAKKVAAPKAAAVKTSPAAKKG